MCLLHKCFSYITKSVTLVLAVLWSAYDTLYVRCLYTYNCSMKLNEILYCRILWKPVQPLTFCLYQIILTAGHDSLLGFLCAVPVLYSYTSYPTFSARACSVQLHFVSHIQCTCLFCTVTLCIPRSVHVPVLYSYTSYPTFSPHALHFVSLKYCMPKMEIQSSATLLQSSIMRTAHWL